MQAINEHGDVLGVLLQEHRNTGAAKRFFFRLTDEQELPEQIVTDGHSNNETALAELKRVHAP